jgi:hypothetical protein
MRVAKLEVDLFVLGVEVHGSWDGTLLRLEGLPRERITEVFALLEGKPSESEKEQPTYSAKTAPALIPSGAVMVASAVQKVPVADAPIALVPTTPEERAALYQKNPKLFLEQLFSARWQELPVPDLGTSLFYLAVDGVVCAYRKPSPEESEAVYFFGTREQELLGAVADYWRKRPLSFSQPVPTPALAPAPIAPSAPVIAAQAPAKTRAPRTPKEKPTAESPKTVKLPEGGELLIHHDGTAWHARAAGDASIASGPCRTETEAIGRASANLLAVQATPVEAPVAPTPIAPSAPSVPVAPAPQPVSESSEEIEDPPHEALKFKRMVDLLQYLYEHGYTDQKSAGEVVLAWQRHFPFLAKMEGRVAQFIATAWGALDIPENNEVGG